MRHISILLFLLLTLTSTAQERNTQLTIQVTSVEGDNLNGQPVTLQQTDYQVGYGTLKLNQEGICTLKVYAGNHLLTISRDGFMPLSYSFVVAEGETAKTVSVTLTEQTRKPFALTAKVNHDVFTGSNSIDLSWNVEAPAFFDDFESYSPFAITFGEWTGIDADLEAAAPLVGVYPNRGVMQYAQIINPLKVEPTWWYDYPILRPYSGQQYVGFTRTSSGNANDDWLISPVITPGTDNVLQFLAKAADRFAERFMVYVTTKTDGPVQSDFVRLDKDNFETADYKGWKEYSYDLSSYAEQPIRFAIRYISDYNRYGSFMLMVDDVYVGQQQPTAAAAPKARRVSAASSSGLASHRSPANPNEQFRITLDGTLVGTTPDYSFTLTDIAAGSHTLGVQAVYLKEESEVSTIQVDIPAEGYAHVTFAVTANSLLSPDGQRLSITSVETTESYEVTVADGKADFGSLPYGQYVVSIAEAAFEAYQQTITVSGDATIDIQLDDHVVTPYNITATPDGSSSGTVYTLRWNQELQFYDSFEDYDDFATGSFGEWLTVNEDQQPVYPIALGGMTNIVSFPGSGTATNPTVIDPMVFNPWQTTPAMLPTDPAIMAPTGDKSVIFFSAQNAKNDKWLISKPIDIHEGYVLNVTAKGYSSMYPESLEFCVSTTTTSPADFKALSKVDQLTSEEWTIYQTDLADYAGQTVRLAVHYTSYDAFLAQIDDFTVGPEDGQGEVVDYGNVVRFDITVDGQKVGESKEPVFTLPELSVGTHTIGIQAIYLNAQSPVAEYILSVTTGINAPTATTPVGSPSGQVYDLQGRRIDSSLNPHDSSLFPHDSSLFTLHSSLSKGVYLFKQNGKTYKISK